MKIEFNNGAVIDVSKTVQTIVNAHNSMKQAGASIPTPITLLTAAAAMPMFGTYTAQLVQSLANKDYATAATTSVALLSAVIAGAYGAIPGQNK